MLNAKGRLSQSFSILISAALVASSLSLADLAHANAQTPQTTEFANRLALPRNLGFVTDVYLPVSEYRRVGVSASQQATSPTRPNAQTPTQPSVVLIQDLHLHYPTQKRIVKILNHLYAKNIVSGPVAVEGVQGVYDTSKLASYPAGKVKDELVDYFMKKGELSGDEAFSILRGDGKILYGVDNAQFYALNRDLFKATMASRKALGAQLAQVQSGLSYLKRKHRNENSVLTQNVKQADEMVGKLQKLLRQEVTLQDARYIAQRLPAFVEVTEKLLNGATGNEQRAMRNTQNLEETIKSAVDFYIVALMRDKPLAENTLRIAHGASHGTALVTGGFHTAGLAAAFKKAGVGYVVITPNVEEAPKADYRELYEKRLMGERLTRAEMWKDLHLPPARSSAPSLESYADTVAARTSLLIPVNRLWEDAAPAFSRRRNTLVGWLEGARGADGGKVKKDAETIMSIDITPDAKAYVIPPYPKRSSDGDDLPERIEAFIRESLGRYVKDNAIDPKISLLLKKTGGAGFTHAYRKGNKITLDYDWVVALLANRGTGAAELHLDLILHHELFHDRRVTVRPFYLATIISTGIAALLSIYIAIQDQSMPWPFIIPLILGGWTILRYLRDRQDESDCLDFNVKQVKEDRKRQEESALSRAQSLAGKDAAIRRVSGRFLERIVLLEDLEERDPVEYARQKKAMINEAAPALFLSGARATPDADAPERDAQAAPISLDPKALLEHADLDFHDVLDGGVPANQYQLIPGAEGRGYRLHLYQQNTGEEGSLRRDLFRVLSNTSKISGETITRWGQGHNGYPKIVISNHPDFIREEICAVNIVQNGQLVIIFNSAYIKEAIQALPTRFGVKLFFEDEIIQQLNNASYDPESPTLPLSEDVDALIERFKDTGIPNEQLKILMDAFRDYDFRFKFEEPTGFVPVRVPTPEAWRRFGLIWAQMSKDKQPGRDVAKNPLTFVIGRDIRDIRDPHSPRSSILDALAAGLTAAGVNVVYIGTEPNCASSYATAMAYLNPDGGVFLTSSHVSAEANVQIWGAKVSMRTGSSGIAESIDANDIKVLSRGMMEKSLADPAVMAEWAVPPAQRGTIRSVNLDPINIRWNTLVGKLMLVDLSSHPDLNWLNLKQEVARGERSFEAIMADWEAQVEIIAPNAMPLKGETVAVDGAGTPSGPLTKAALENLGATVVSVRSELKPISGPHQADPSNRKEGNLKALEEAMVKGNIPVGFSFDLDGDRLAALMRLIRALFGKARVNPKDPKESVVDIAPDNLAAALLAFLVLKSGLTRDNVANKRFVVIVDISASEAVKIAARSAEKLLKDLLDVEIVIEVRQTDTGYVYLNEEERRLREECKADGRELVVLIKGELSGHAWLMLVRENPIEMLMAFIGMAMAFKKKAQAANPEYKDNPYVDAYEDAVAPFVRTDRMQPLIARHALADAAEILSPAGSSWDGKANQAMIAEVKHFSIIQAQQYFAIGRRFETAYGPVIVEGVETKMETRDPKVGEHYVYAVITLSDAEGERKRMGRFTLRASANDPTFVDVVESRVRRENNETPEDYIVQKRFSAAAAIAGKFFEDENLAYVADQTLSGKKPNEATEQGLGVHYREHLQWQKDRHQDAGENLNRAIEHLNAVRAASPTKGQTVPKFDVEKRGAAEIALKLRSPLFTEDPAMADRYAKGGFKDDGYGVPNGAANDGSHAKRGTQGYYSEDKNKNGRTGKEEYQFAYDLYRKFFKKHADRGTPIRYIIKVGIGGQHTPMQAIANGFMTIVDAQTGEIVGEYELGKDFEVSINAALRRLGVSWNQIAVIPSSKSGSTDESMLIFQQIMHAMVKHAALDAGDDSSYMLMIPDMLFELMHESAVDSDGNDKKGTELFKGFSVDELVDRVNRKLDSGEEQLKHEVAVEILRRVLGNMVFETTPNVNKSRLAAFIMNSGLDKILGEDAPPMVDMFDNVGGRWTADVHMLLPLAYYGLDVEAYYNIRKKGIEAVRDGTHRGNRIGHEILDKGYRHVALVLPKEYFWMGKAIEQNLNESIWQDGFVNLIAISEEDWVYQQQHYKNRADRLVIDMAGIVDSRGFNVMELSAPQLSQRPKGMRRMRWQKKNRDELAQAFGELFTTFYGMTNTIGTRLIDRALRAKGFTSSDVNLNDLNNSATKIVRANLFLLQPYVELAKEFLERDFKKLQAEELERKGAIRRKMESVQASARDQELKTNVEIHGVEWPKRIKTPRHLRDVARTAFELAQREGRKLVTVMYEEGAEFRVLKAELTEAGIEWVMQGTADQHISIQQMLAQPQHYLPFIVSFVPERGRELSGLPSVFAKAYLNMVSPHLARDTFADAIYRAFTDKEEGRGAVGGKAFFLRLPNTINNREFFGDTVKSALLPDGSSLRSNRALPEWTSRAFAMAASVVMALIGGAAAVSYLMQQAVVSVGQYFSTTIDTVQPMVAHSVQTASVLENLGPALILGSVMGLGLIVYRKIKAAYDRRASAAATGKSLTLSLARQNFFSAAKALVATPRGMMMSFALLAGVAALVEPQSRQFLADNYAASSAALLTAA